MFRIDASSRIPIHEQIKSGLRTLVDKGLLRPGERVPGAKELAESLVVSPAQVSRAYRDLQKEGFLEVKRGEGNYIASRLSKPADPKMDAVQQLIAGMRACVDAGLSWQEIAAVLEYGRARHPATEGPKGGSSLLEHLQKFAEGAGQREGSCPYCREKITTGESRVLCLVCGTAHHEECWNERNHCSVFGCKGKTQIPI